MNEFAFSVGPNRTPWKHQLDIFAWAKGRSNVALFMDMGTAKTAITVNLLAHKFLYGDLDKVLIVVPLRYADTWVEEFNRCFPDIKVVSLLRNEAGKPCAGPERLARLSIDAKVYVVNYEALGSTETFGKRRHFELSEIGQALKLRQQTERWGVVCDESTHIKNPRSTRAKAVYELGERAKFRTILSGTPMPQGPEDIFGQYLFLEPEVFGYRFTLFRARFLKMGGYMGKEILGLQPGMVETFNKLVYSIAKRVMKSECMDMPPKVYMTLSYDLDRKTQKLYDQLRDEWLIQMKDQDFAVTNGLTKSLRLAQICTGFLGSKEVDEHGRPKTVSVDCEVKTKLAALLEFIDETEGKVIIWCKWQKNVQDVINALAKRQIRAVDYYSGTSDPRANEMAFRDDPSVKCFVGTGESGGMGLNLQGPEVKTVVYYSQDYKGLIREQSEDRAYRGGIHHVVTIVDMVAKGTIEEAIVKALKEKIDVQKWILQYPDQFAKGVIQEATHA